jgi:hypothetical protein
LNTVFPLFQGEAGKIIIPVKSRHLSLVEPNIRKVYSPLVVKRGSAERNFLRVFGRAYTSLKFEIGPVKASFQIRIRYRKTKVTQIEVKKIPVFKGWMFALGGWRLLLQLK